MDFSNYAISDGSRIHKAQKIISCIEFVLRQKFQDAKVLEIGAGSGIISYYIAKAGNYVVSIDLDISLYNSTSFSEKIINYMLANGISLPFKDGTFDIIICNQVIEHIPRNKQSDLIHEIYRVLNTNGLLYLATPNKLWPVEPHTKLPFITYLPKRIADAYVNITRGIDNFNVYLLTYFQLRQILSVRFDQITDLTPLVIKNPELFSIKNEISKKIQYILIPLPLTLLQKISLFYPSWILVGKK
jgi:2-polyprenyl-3-methyl-5-hydroxy-6-metoxy-1,4-benzoquinol methylase